MHQRKCITSGASPLLHQTGASPPVHHPRRGASPLLHHLLPPPCWSRAPCRSSPPRASWRASHSHILTLLHSVALIIALNLEDGHRCNLLVPLSNHLILKDHRPNLLGLNDYSVESTHRH